MTGHEDEWVMLSVRVPKYLKDAVDRAGETNQQLTIDALEQKLGRYEQSVLEREAEELRDRIKLERKHRDKRDRTISDLEDDLEDVLAALESEVSHEQQVFDDLAGRVAFKDPRRFSSSDRPSVSTSREWLEQWADDADVTVEELIAHARDLKDKWGGDGRPDDAPGPFGGEDGE